MIADWPDLQKLIEEHGSYPAIPATAWAEFDRQIAACQREYRRGLERARTRSGR